MVFVRSIVAANLGMISTGFCYGWILASPVRLLAQGKINVSEAQWIYSCYTIGSIKGVIVSYLLLDAIGRRKTLLCSSIFHIFNSLMVSNSLLVKELIATQILVGVGNGIAATSILLYFSEITDHRKRGKIIISGALTSKFGELACYVSSLFLSSRVVSLFAIFVSVLSTMFSILAVESPYYLIQRDETRTAKTVLSKLRQTRNIDEEMKMIKDTMKIDNTMNNGTFDLVFLKNNRKATRIVCILSLTQYLCGTWIHRLVFLHYCEYDWILTTGLCYRLCYGNHDDDDSSCPVLTLRYYSIILATVQIISIEMSLIFVESFGRRFLLIISIAGIGISNLFLTILDFCNEMHSGNLTKELIIVSIILSVFAYSLGLSTIPNIMVAELFPPSVKSKAICFFEIVTDFSFLIIYLLASPFLKISGSIFHATFLSTIFSVISAIYVFLMIPETKCKTFEEIQKFLCEEFRRRPRIFKRY